VNVQAILFGTIGGIGMFIFGMKLLSEGMQKIAGPKLRKLLEMLTTHRLAGVLVGTVVTGIIQSSSATTVMVVGFVNAGLMNLTQSAGVILGADIGTTITAQMIAFKVHKFALPILGVGALLYIFGGRKNFRNAGQALLGFGLLFFGLATMSGAFVHLKDSPTFINLFIKFSTNPLLAIFAGTVLTMILQSSSATVGITIALASAGMLDFSGAFALVLGENIGTTITAQLASIGTSVSARRSAMMHTLFKVFGVIYMYALLFVKVDGVPVFLKFIDIITPGNVFADGGNIERHIANAHTFFNVFNVLIFLPLIGWVINIAKKLVPGEDETVERGAKHLDKRMLHIPAVALDQAQKETIRMAKIAKEMIHLSMQGLYNHKDFSLRKVLDREEITDELQREIIDFLVELEQRELSEAESQQSSKLMHLVNDIEKVGDHAENIVQLAQIKVEDRLRFSKEGEDELRVMQKNVEELFEKSIIAFENNDVDLAWECKKIEDLIDFQKGEFRTHYIKRLSNGHLTSAAGIIFIDVVSNLERIGDHAVKLAKWTISKPKSHLSDTDENLAPVA